jgi:uncharacterized protein
VSISPVASSAAQTSLLSAYLARWRRRHWLEDKAALAVFATRTPITVVTGASDGIGLALARRCAAAGHDVVLIARGPDRVVAAAQAIALQYRVRAIPLALDVTDGDACQKIDAVVADANAYADVLINNAGIGLSGPIATADPMHVDQLLRLNIEALTRLTRHFVPGMLLRGRGGILNVASLAAYTPGPYQAVYYASKAYVLSLTEALAHEVAGYGVTISALAPGAVDTAFHARMNATSALYTHVLPMPTPTVVADRAYRRFCWGQRVYVPGVLNTVVMLCTRILPHRTLARLASVLLRPRS